MPLSLSRRQFIAAVAVAALAGLPQAAPARAHQMRKTAMVEAVRRAYLTGKHSDDPAMGERYRQSGWCILTAYTQAQEQGLTRLEARNVCHAGRVMARRDYGTPRDPFGPLWRA